MTLSLKLLGEFEVREESEALLSLPTRKTRALLAYLAFNADKPQLRDRLVELLWSDRSERQARHSLSQALMAIRKLGDGDDAPLLNGDSERVMLHGASIDIDLTRFRALLDKNPAEAARLYDGPFLDGLSISEPFFEEWLTAARADLNSLACDALKRAADKATSDGKLDNAIEYIRLLLKLEPVREDAHRRLMQLLRDNGDRSEALRQYQTCVNTLERELNIGPDVATVELFETIRAQRATTDPSRSTTDVDDRHKSLIAILPFNNMSTDVDLDVLAEGLVEDVIAGLERFNVVSVVSKTSSSQFRGKRPNARTIGAELGAAYLMEGSIRKAGNFVRVAAQVIDATTDQNLWAQRYDRPLNNPFDLQDDVSAGIVAAIEPVLLNAELRKGRRTEPGFGSYAKAKEAAWHLYRFTKENNAKAIGLLEEVIAENPNVAGRYEALAMGHMWNVVFGWTVDPTRSIGQAMKAAVKAVELKPDDAYKLSVLAWTYAHMGDGGRAIANVDRAIEIYPASTVPLGVKAWICGNIGFPEMAIKSLDAMLARTTEHPFVFQSLCGGALGHLALGNWEEAGRLAETATVRRPNSLTGWVVQTVAYYNAGNEAEAARRFLNLIELNPDMTEESLSALFSIQPTAFKESIFAALRALGLPAR